MRWIHEDCRVVLLVRRRGVVLGHGVVRVGRRRLMKTPLGRMLVEWMVAAVVLVLVVLLMRVLVVGVVVLWRLALLARMRLLGRVVDIVVWPYSVIARQRVSDAWVPPERTALDGRRTLRRKNLVDGRPPGLLASR